jgi:hypothetical protein
VEDIMKKTIEESGTSVYVDDKWDEKELKKGHKLIDYEGRELDIDTKSTGYIVGKYEYMPDGSWKGSGTCTYIDEKSGDKLNESWEEGSHLKGIYTYKNTGGTGKCKGASGGGTYTLEKNFTDSLKKFTDALSGGTYNGTIELP